MLLFFAWHSHRAPFMVPDLRTVPETRTYPAHALFGCVLVRPGLREDFDAEIEQSVFELDALGWVSSEE